MMLSTLHVLTGADAEEYVQERSAKSIAIGIEKGVAEQWARISLNVRNEMAEHREPIDRESVTKVS